MRKPTKHQDQEGRTLHEGDLFLYSEYDRSSTIKKGIVFKNHTAKQLRWLGTWHGGLGLKPPSNTFVYENEEMRQKVIEELLVKAKRKLQNREPGDKHYENAVDIIKFLEEVK